MVRQVNKAGMDLIKKWEGFRDKAYQDSVKVWTIGYGHTKNVKLGDTITQEEALELLQEEVAGFAASVQKYLITNKGVPLNDNQFSALVSLTYNIGAGWMIRKYGLFKLLVNLEYARAASRILAYHYAGGKPLQGLRNRRKEERELFLKSVGGSKAAYCSCCNLTVFPVCPRCGQEFPT